MTDAKQHEWTRPWPLTGIVLRCHPWPQEKRSVGSHPSGRRGSVGTEILGVRKLEPGDDRRSYSPAHSPNLKEPHAIVFRREQELRVIVLVDLPPAMGFGNPPKRDLALKIAATILRMTIGEPNGGAATIIGVGSELRVSPWVLDEAALRGATHCIARLRLRQERGDALPRALRRLATEEEECLIIILSDFLFSPTGTDLEQFENSYQILHDAGHDIVCIRVLDAFEQSLPSSASVTVLAGRRSVWTSPDSARHLQETQQRIRNELMRITGDDRHPDDAALRFLEVSWSREREAVREDVKQFWKHRARKARA